MRTTSLHGALCAALLSAGGGCDPSDDDLIGSTTATTGASTATCVGDLCDDDGIGGGPPSLCDGIVATCDAQSETSACDEVIGCELLIDCVGTSADCDLLNQASCNGQIGCYWSYVVDGPAFCAGTAATCPELGSTACESQQGCHVETVCSGQATPCGAIASAGDCARQPGCNWQ